ncbi:hypothetical protein A1O3_07765 [Capronia epimyces CBS 606.96]|uniref:Peptidase A1 domain-containing protein n=1 Tax=Capronia epimyces CBS 606.96 TaxID=1182542 RepID=W9XMP5_9EURO|nr:uncharacterized protein A1O3_07765 [Capronia epimyces CBS 606.96]EXJ81473.1 hypothetical protein A1O3_07765 [Capronia epimyces CBS 606.96]
MASSCELEPLVSPIKDVQVNKPVLDSFMKGIPAKIGTPEQDIVLMPWAELNNIWIYDQQAFCDPTSIFSEEICFVRRGSYYLEDDSSSFKQALDIIDAGGASTETTVTGSELGIKNLVSTGLGGTDTLKIGSTEALDTFPVAIPRQDWDGGYTTLHALGFGSNSTYLNALLEAKQIGARVWSIFWGRMWLANPPMDGSLVLGGYDRTKVIGQDLTQNLDFGSTGCWTGTEQTLFPANTVLPVCLVPQRQLLLEAPGSIYSKFENVTLTKNIGLSFCLHWGAHLFDTGTHSRIFNESQREVLISSLGDQPATLGRYFLTAAYLMVDQDAGTFTLWQANPSNNTDLVAITNEQSMARCPGANPSRPANSSTPIETAPSNSTSRSEPISTGAIAGIVIGVIAILALLGLGGLFFLRRRTRRFQAIPPPRDSTGSIGPQELYGSSARNIESVVPYTDKIFNEARQTRQEMAGWAVPKVAYEMDARGSSPRVLYS